MTHSWQVQQPPVMVCKVLSQFADKGFLKVSRTVIEVIDRDQLEQFIKD